MAWGSKGGDVAAPSGGNALSFIGREVTITGNISGQGDLHIDGEIQGDIGCGTLIIGGAGRVKGNISANRATIAGSVEGTVSAETLIVEKSARVAGDLSYENVSIETGAQVEGRLTQRAATGGGELKLVASMEAAE